MKAKSVENNECLFVQNMNAVYIKNRLSLLPIQNLTFPKTIS